MYKKYLFALPLFLLFISVANPLIAGEIQYATVKNVQDSSLHIQYNGPTGPQNFVCNVITIDCSSYGTVSPNFFPEIHNNSSYTKSSDGKYAIVETVSSVVNGLTTYSHALYDISTDTPKVLSIIPYTDSVIRYKFSWSNNHVVLFGKDGAIMRYDISTKTLNSVNISRTDFALLSLSPSAKYISSFNYVKEEHQIWNTNTGNLVVLPSQIPTYVEFSQNEKYAAYTDKRDGYQTLYIADIEKVSNRELSIKRVFVDDFTVEDYLWFKDDLYAVGNTKNNPYEWVLYRYSPVDNKSIIVAKNVSYGDYMRPIGEYALSFLVIDGKNSHVALYDPISQSIRTIEPVKSSPSSKNIIRTVMKFDGGAQGVLYEPIKNKKNSQLFVWLHGGPKRQTSFGYHSYLSYAVYDELLERLVENGAYVLKLDYAGSYGHGNKFMDALHNNIGVADVDHVVDASRTIQKKYNIGKTYLIGNSYGGYLGPKTLVDNGRYFDGAIAINGVFDWYSLIDRIPSSPFKTYFNGLPNLLLDNMKFYEQASIIDNLSKIKRKNLLLIYGENDSTVPTWQTREFYEKANAINKNTKLLMIEGEDHIIRQRSNLDLMCNFIAKELSITKLKCD